MHCLLALLIGCFRDSLVYMYPPHEYVLLNLNTKKSTNTTYLIPHYCLYCT